MVLSGYIQIMDRDRYSTNPGEHRSHDCYPTSPSIDDLDREVLRAICEGAKSRFEVCTKTRVSIYEIAALLTRLERAGWVSSHAARFGCHRRASVTPRGVSQLCKGEVHGCDGRSPVSV